MIVVVYADGHEASAQEVVTSLTDAFHGHVSVTAIAASAAATWPDAEAWDDLMLLMFQNAALPHNAQRFLTDYLSSRGVRALLLPVALDPNHQRPPEPAQGIKSLPYDAGAKSVGGRIVRRVGAMLGLRVRPAENKIFISYSARDGCEIAKQLEKHLAGFGYQPWRDEAREVDDESKILPGSPVQQQIDAALDDANLMLLVDTPEAPRSKWIRHEVDTANAALLPILPLCFRASEDAKQGPRFRSLLDLRRWVPLSLPDPATVSPLSAAELDMVITEADRYLCEIFQRRCRVPFIVEKAFVTREFAWRTLDKRLLMFESEKKHSSRLATKVISHCSIFDQLHGPALKRFAEFLAGVGHPNFSLYVYEGEMMPEAEIQEILQEEPGSVIVLHHQELATLIDSNFTTLST
jgi:hypothetical protein